MYFRGKGLLDRDVQIGNFKRLGEEFNASLGRRKWPERGMTENPLGLAHACAPRAQVMSAFEQSVAGNRELLDRLTKNPPHNEPQK
jgi:hypothetical protein